VGGRLFHNFSIPQLWNYGMDYYIDFIGKFDKIEYEYCGEEI